MTDPSALTALRAFVFSAAAIFGCDRVLANFREAPDVRRVLLVRGATIAAAIAMFAFYGSTMFLVLKLFATETAAREAATA